MSNEKRQEQQYPTYPPPYYDAGNAPRVIHGNHPVPIYHGGYVMQPQQPVYFMPTSVGPAHVLQTNTQSEASSPSQQPSRFSAEHHKLDNAVLPSATELLDEEKQKKESFFKLKISPVLSLFRALLILALELVDVILAVTVYYSVFTGCSANYFSNRGLNLQLFSTLYLVPLFINAITFLCRLCYMIWVLRVKFRGNFRHAINSYIDMTAITNDKMNPVLALCIIRATLESLFSSYLMTYIAVYTIGTLSSMSLWRIVLSIFSSFYTPAGAFHNMVLRPIFQRFSKEKFTFSGLSVFITVLLMIGTVIPLVWMVSIGNTLIYAGKHITDTVAIYSGVYYFKSYQCPNGAWNNVTGNGAIMAVPNNMNPVIGPLPNITGKDIMTPPVPNTCSFQFSGNYGQFSCMIPSLSIPMGQYANTIQLSNVTVASGPTPCQVFYNGIPFVYNSKTVFVNVIVAGVLDTKCIPHIS